MVETRKLVAILAADVVGYSRLAGCDEDRTLARLRALRSDLIDPTIAVHHGRVVKRTGDGSIVNSQAERSRYWRAFVKRNLTSLTRKQFVRRVAKCSSLAERKSGLNEFSIAIVAGLTTSRRIGAQPKPSPSYFDFDSSNASRPIEQFDTLLRGGSAPVAAKVARWSARPSWAAVGIAALSWLERHGFSAKRGQPRAIVVAPTFLNSSARLPVIDLQARRA